jgi:hypothetical protein
VHNWQEMTRAAIVALACAAVRVACDPCPAGAETVSVFGSRLAPNGAYVRVRGEIRNGSPVYTRDEANWLYSSEDGDWVVGRGSASHKHEGGTPMVMGTMYNGGSLNALVVAPFARFKRAHDQQTDATQQALPNTPPVDLAALRAQMAPQLGQLTPDDAERKWRRGVEAAEGERKRRQRDIDRANGSLLAQSDRVRTRVQVCCRGPGGNSKTAKAAAPACPRYAEGRTRENAWAMSLSLGSTDAEL